MKTVIHINQHNIKHNRKPENKDNTKPVITAKTYLSTTYSNSVKIVDNNGNIIASIIYSPEKPLGCGAHVWIEADNKNVIVEV